MESIDFYTAVLESLGLSIEGDRIMSVEEDGSHPVVSAGKELIMPTETGLKGQDWDKVVAFAPLGENLLRGESEVIRTLATIIKVEVNIRATGLLAALAKVAADKDNHKNLDPEQGELLEALPVVDARFMQDLAKTLERVDLKTHDTSMVDFNLRRLGSLNGKKYKRLCNVSFPITEVEGTKVMGVNWRVKDVQLLQALLKYAFPNCDVAGHYSAGTESSVAPYLVALLNAYGNVQERINELAKLFKDYPEFKALKAPMKFQKFMGKLEKLRDELPVLKGNEGAVPKGGDNEPVGKLSDPAPAGSIRRPSLSRAVADAPRPATQEEKVNVPWEEEDQAVPVATSRQPQQTQAREPAQSSGGVSYAEFRARQAQAQGRPIQQPMQHQQQPQRLMTIHDQVYGYNNQNRYQQQYTYDPGYDIGNSPYSNDYRPPHPNQQQRPGYGGYQQPPQPRGRGF